MRLYIEVEDIVWNQHDEKWYYERAFAGDEDQGGVYDAVDEYFQYLRIQGREGMTEKSKPLEINDLIVGYQPDQNDGEQDIDEGQDDKPGRACGFVERVRACIASEIE